jgi:hypothetical protein
MNVVDGGRLALAGGGPEVGFELFEKFFRRSWRNEKRLPCVR